MIIYVFAVFLDMTSYVVESLQDAKYVNTEVWLIFDSSAFTLTFCRLFFLLRGNNWEEYRKFKKQLVTLFVFFVSQFAISNLIWLTSFYCSAPYPDNMDHPIKLCYDLDIVPGYTLYKILQIYKISNLPQNPKTPSNMKNQS